MPVSKRLQQFVAFNNEAEFIQVDPALDYRNPSLTTTTMVQSDVLLLLLQLKSKF